MVTIFSVITNLRGNINIFYIIFVSKTDLRGKWFHMQVIYCIKQQFINWKMDFSLYYFLPLFSTTGENRRDLLTPATNLIPFENNYQFYSRHSNRPATFNLIINQSTLELSRKSLLFFQSAKFGIFLYLNLVILVSKFGNFCT